MDTEKHLLHPKTEKRLRDVLRQINDGIVGGFTFPHWLSHSESMEAAKYFVTGCKDDSASLWHAPHGRSKREECEHVAYTIRSSQSNRYSELAESLEQHLGRNAGRGPEITEKQRYKGLMLYILRGTTERIVSGELCELDPSAAMWHETECVDPCMDRMKAMVDEWESEGMLKHLPNASVSSSGDEPGYAPGACSVSFSPSDVDAYIASRPYTDAGIGSGSPMHDTDELMDFYAWLSQKQNAEVDAPSRARSEERR